MSDWADKAAEREQEIRDDALAARARQAGGRLGETSAMECAVCGEPIPEARRVALAGVQTCIECQDDLEREINNVWRVR
jgi:phage/conjugal plasmid C-4 type zinc finger TraR family protein